MSTVTPPPVPTRSVLADSGGLATRPWISFFTTLAARFGFYQTIQSSGIDLPQENNLNFTAPLVATDNPTTGATDISFSTPASAFSVQFGTGTAIYTGNNYSSQDVLFAKPFGVVPKVTASPTSFPRGVNTPMTTILSNKSATGFTASFACAVPTGGGGSTIDQQITFDWIAIA